MRFAPGTAAGAALVFCLACAGGQGFTGVALMSTSHGPRPLAAFAATELARVVRCNNFSMKGAFVRLDDPSCHTKRSPLPPYLAGRTPSNRHGRLVTAHPRTPLMLSMRREGGEGTQKGVGGSDGERRTGGGGGGKLPIQLRLLATLPYMMPILDGIKNGDNVFRLVPELKSAVYTVLAPLLAVWDNIPFLPLLTFILLSIYAREQNSSRYVRFNVQQAILVDVLSIILGLLGTGAGMILSQEGTDMVTNFSFYCLVGAVAYAMAETVRGRLPNQIPLISAAADLQIGL